MAERKARGERRENSNAQQWVALQSAADEPDLGVDAGVKNFFRARFSSTPGTRAQNPAVAP
jgi:hypothetical protein